MLIGDMRVEVINSIYGQILSRMRYCMHYVMHDMHANGVIYSGGQYVVVWDGMQNKIHVVQENVY